MAKKYSAQCACGAIKFEFDTDPTFIADCYCKDCQKSSGGAMATFFGIPKDDFTLISGKPKSFHYVAESGKGLDRNFCPDCGARLFSSNLESFPDLVFVTIGSLDQSDGIEPIEVPYDLKLHSKGLCPHFAKLGPSIASFIRFRTDPGAA